MSETKEQIAERQRINAEMAREEAERQRVNQFMAEYWGIA